VLAAVRGDDRAMTASTPGRDAPSTTAAAAGRRERGSTDPIAGLHVPLVTPFAADGSVDLAALRRLAARVLDDGADGLVALGTTGEPLALGAAERDAVVDCCAEACAARGAPLTVGVDGADTATAVREVARLGGRDGVSAVLAVVPPFVRAARAGVVAHYRALVAVSPVPLIAYDNPPRTGMRLGAEALLALHAAEPRIAAVKLSVPALDDDALALLAEAPPGFAVLAGEDALILALLAHGGAGAICAAANCATGRFAALVRAGRDGGDGSAAAGDRSAARRHHEQLLPLVRALGAEPRPSVIKGLLHRRGELATPSLRLPNVAASAGAVDAAERALAVAGAAGGLALAGAVS